MTDELVRLIGTRFLSRIDCKAVQRPSGAYEPDRTKLTKRDLLAHLAGTATYGHYMLNGDDQCKLFAYDIDVIPSYTPPPVPKDPDFKPDMWTPLGLLDRSPRDVFRDPDHSHRSQLIVELRTVAEALAARTKRILSIDVAIAYSGSKGLHVYGFTGATPAQEVLEAGQYILETSGVFEPTRGNNFYRHTNPPEWGFPHIEIELFPKQTSLAGKDLGNLMRLPLGKHRKTKRDAFFIDVNAPAHVLTAVDPVTALTKGDPWAA